MTIVDSISLINLKRLKGRAPRPDARPLSPDDTVDFFRNLPLIGAGVARVRVGNNLSQTFHVEHRHFSLALYSNKETSSAPGSLPNEIIVILDVTLYKFYIRRRLRKGARIYLTGPGLKKNDFFLEPDGAHFDSWVSKLAEHQNTVLPSLRTLDMYTQIGKGGNSEVFRVASQSTGEVFALKVMDKSKAMRSIHSVKQALAERNIMVLIGNHPFLLPISFAFQNSLHLFIGTPYCTNGNFLQYLQKRHKAKSTSSASQFKPKTDRNFSPGFLTEDEAVGFMAQIVLAIEHLHGHGVVHCDLKPENILVFDNYQLRLGDFGLARHLHQMEDDGSTLGTPVAYPDSEYPLIFGTEPYMAPEVWKGEYGFDGDMWSLGVIAYQIIVGRFPFSSETIRKKIYGNVLLPDYLSKDTMDFLSGLLQPDREKRGNLSWVKTHSFFRSVDWKDIIEQANVCPEAQSVHSPGSRQLPNHEQIESSNVNPSFNERQKHVKDMLGLSDTPHGKIAIEHFAMGFDYTAEERQSKPSPLPATNFSKSGIPASSRVGAMATKATKVRSYFIRSKLEEEKAIIKRDSF